MSKKQAKIIILVALITLSLSGAFYFLGKKYAVETPLVEVPVKPATQKEYKNEKLNESLLTETEESKKEEIKFILKIGEESKEVVTIEGNTLYQALKSTPGLVLEGKEYPELGFFVTKIGLISELSSGGGKNLFYYVNDEESSMGVSSYVPKSGDIISWRLK